MSRSRRCGFISLLYSIGDKPLDLWSKHVSLDGRIRRVNDETLNGDRVIEITGPRDISIPTNITCPANFTDALNIKLPVLVLIVKNLELELKLEFQLLDKEQHRRKFILTTYNHEKPSTANASYAYVSLKLEEGWNNLEINLQSLCHDVYGTDYQALQRIMIYPNCRLRRVYLQDRHYNDDETPVELCQAFFDMYMLKWGIHSVERSCQTEELYTGPPRLNDLEYFMTENSTLNCPSTSSSTYSIESRDVQIKDTNDKKVETATILDRNKMVGLKNNFKSVNELDKEIKIHNNHEFSTARSKQRPGNVSYSVNISIDKFKQKNKFANLCEKKKKKTDRTREKQEVCVIDVNAILNGLKEKKESRSFPRIEKSQYLKMQIKENFFSTKSETEGHIFKEWPYKYNDMSQEIEKNTIGSTKDNITNRKSTTKEIFEQRTNLNHFDPNFIMSAQKCVPVSKDKRASNTETPSNLNTDNSNAKDVKSSQGDGLQSRSVKTIKDIIDKVEKVKEQLNCHDAYFKGSTVTTERTMKDMPVDVPRFVEVQTKSLKTRSKKMLLATDEAVRSFLEIRHVINKTILEKLQTRGLTMTEVELSIYNSKNRRNCYGQGKLIECHKSCANKGNGFSSVKPLEVDASLRRKQLPLNDKICMRLRNELDAALLQLKTTHVRITSEVVQDTIGTIVEKASKTSNVHFISTQEAEFVKRKVNYVKDTSKRDSDTDQYREHLKAETNCSDIVQNINQSNAATRIINVLFQKRIMQSSK